MHTAKSWIPTGACQWALDPVAGKNGDDVR